MLLEFQHRRQHLLYNTYILAACIRHHQQALETRHNCSNVASYSCPLQFALDVRSALQEIAHWPKNPMPMVCASLQRENEIFTMEMGREPGYLRGSGPRRNHTHCEIDGDGLADGRRGVHWAIARGRGKLLVWGKKRGRRITCMYVCTREGKRKKEGRYVIDAAGARAGRTFLVPFWPVLRI